MADQDASLSELPASGTVNVGKLVLQPLEHCIAAGVRQAFKIGVPGHAVIEMLLNHLASVIAMVEPAGARIETQQAILNGALQSLIQQHVEARKTSTGGVFIPQPGDLEAAINRAANHG